MLYTPVTQVSTCTSTARFFYVLLTTHYSVTWSDNFSSPSSSPMLIQFPCSFVQLALLFLIKRQSYNSPRRLMWVSVSVKRIRRAYEARAPRRRLCVGSISVVVVLLWRWESCFVITSKTPELLWLVKYIVNNNVYCYSVCSIIIANNFPCQYYCMSNNITQYCLILQCSIIGLSAWSTLYIDN